MAGDAGFERQVLPQSSRQKQGTTEFTEDTE